MPTVIFFGQNKWAEHSIDAGVSSDTDASGNVYTTGNFGGTVDFDPGTGTANLTSNGFDDIFIQKLDANGNFLWVKQMGGTSNDSRSIRSLSTQWVMYYTRGIFGIR